MWQMFFLLTALFIFSPQVLLSGLLPLPVLALYLDDKLKTEADSYANIEFLSGGVIAVNQNTTIQITGIRDAEDVTERSFIQNVIITSGEIWAKITKQQEEIQFETKGGVVSIKGTEFVIEEYPDKDETTLSVLEGQVAFRDNNSKETLYNAGEKVKIALQKIEEVKKVLPEELRNELETKLNPEFIKHMTHLLENFPVDPNSLPFDPNSMPFDPNNMPFDPNNMPFDPNNMPFDPNNMPFDPNNLPSTPDKPGNLPEETSPDTGNEVSFAGKVEGLYPASYVPQSGLCFAWLEQPKPLSGNYMLTVSDNNEMKNPFISRICRDNAFEVTSEVEELLTEGKKLYWQVEVLDKKDKATGIKSEVIEFIIEVY